MTEEKHVKPTLEMVGVGKSFGATQALRNVSLSVKSGEILALIGENGAGKSTLMKLLSGAHAADEGSMYLGEQPYAPNGPNEARRRGIAMIYQELNLAPDLSVEDNIMLGQEFHRLGWIHHRKQRERVHKILKLLGHPELSPDRLVHRLSIGAQQLVEIARALVSDAQVMIFDEPTSSLPKKDVDRLFEIIRLLRDQGLAIIYISHFLEEIRSLANRFVVLRDGQPAGEGELANTSDQQIITMMAGRSVETLFPRTEHVLGPVRLKVERLSGKPSPTEVSFEVRQGEIFGLFGLVGAGRSEILRRLFGLDPIAEGTIHWNDQPLYPNPRLCIRSGIGFVSEDRKGEGLAQQMSIEDNLTLSALGAYSRMGFLSNRRRSSSARSWMERFAVKAKHEKQTITHLSGGNQQKVAIARVLHQGSDLLLLDEPTRGIDVRTKSEIYRWIGELASEGHSIIFVSSYLPELLAICDTLGVMARGRLQEVRPACRWTEQEILTSALANPLDA